jgi:histidine ammonia-lyase
MTHNASSLTLHPGRVTLAELRRIHAGPVQLVLDASARAGLQKSLATVQRIVDEDQVVYGINTGFGKLASTKLRTTAWLSCSATWCCRTAWARATRCPTTWCASSWRPRP